MSASYRHDLLPYSTSTLTHEFGDAPLFVLKDPRFSLVLNLWLPTFAAMNITVAPLLALRHPAEVMASLRRREQMPGGIAAPLWLHYMLEAERNTRHRPRAVLSYDRIMQDWRGCLTRFAAKSGIAWRVPFKSAAPAIGEFLRPTLRHHYATPSKAAAGKPPIADWIAETYDALRRIELGDRHRAVRTVGSCPCAIRHMARQGTTRDRGRRHGPTAADQQHAADHQPQPRRVARPQRGFQVEPAEQQGEDDLHLTDRERNEPARRNAASTHWIACYPPVSLPAACPSPCLPVRRLPAACPSLPTTAGCRPRDTRKSPMPTHAATAAGLLSASLLFASLAWISPARAETLLHLADTETVTATPDELAASLRAEATSATPADAQQRVNAAIADALAHAQKVAAVTAGTGAYNVWHVGPTPQNNTDRWQASQSLELTSKDSVALLTLVGVLQHNGLAVGELNWRLSRETERKAHDEATRRPSPRCAARHWRRRDCWTCGSNSFKQVRLDSTARCRAALRRCDDCQGGPVPPNAVAVDVPVSATAEADAILLPK